MSAIKVKRDAAKDEAHNNAAALQEYLKVMPVIRDLVVDQTLFFK